MKTMRIHEVHTEHELDEFFLDEVERIIKNKYPDLWETYDAFIGRTYIDYQVRTDILPDELRPPFQEAVDWLNENKDKYYLPDVDKFVL